MLRIQSKPASSLAAMMDSGLSGLTAPSCLRRKHTCTHTHTHTHTHTRAHTCTRTHARNHMHTHTHTRAGPVCLLDILCGTLCRQWCSSIFTFISRCPRQESLFCANPTESNHFETNRQTARNNSCKLLEQICSQLLRVQVRHRTTWRP